jgi:hypothetical protein
MKPRRLVLPLLLALACGSGSVKGPADVSSRLTSEMLGGDPDIAVTVRARRMSEDPLWGSLVRCAAASATGTPESNDVVYRTEALDGWAREDGSAVLVLRGTPRFDPAAFRSDKGPEWLAGRPIGANVTEHAPAPGGAGAWLYAVPDGTYVLARGHAVERTRATLARVGRSPAPLEGAESALALAWLDGSYAARHAGTGRELDGVSSSSAALLSGAEITAVMQLSFDSEARAVSGEHALRDALERTCGAFCAKLAPHVRLARSGHELRAELHAPGEALEEARHVLCATREPKPEAHPLPADPSKPDVLPPRVAPWQGRDLVVAWAPTEPKGGGDAVLQLGVYDDRSKLLAKVDTTPQPLGSTALTLEPAVAQNRIALRSAPDSIALFDLTNGKRVVEIAVPARGRLCASNADGLVFVEDDDPARQTLISVDIAQVIPSTRPPWGPPRGRAAPCNQPSTLAACADASIAPDLPDFVPSHVLVAGEDGVVLGERLSDRHVPMVAGFDAKTRALRWKRVLPTATPDVAAEGSPRIADVAGGKLLVEFDDWHGRWKLAAIDAKTGAALWDAALPEPVYFVLSSTRLFYPEVTRAPTATRIRAIDLASGRAL